MIQTKSNNLVLLRFDFLSCCAELIHGVSTRNGPPDDPVFDLAWSHPDNPGKVCNRLGIAAGALASDPERICCARQVHGKNAVCVDAPPEHDDNEPCCVCGDFDALITDRPGITLLIRVADCVPIILYDPVRRIVAVIHAGWKGTLAGVAGLTVERMRSHYGCSPRDLLAGIGPSIGPCCFEVGDDVAARFRKTSFVGNCVHDVQGSVRIDLPHANRSALLNSGLRGHNIEMSGYCTACSLDIFFSHRAEQGHTGRFGLFAGMRA